MPNTHFTNSQENEIEEELMELENKKLKVGILLVAILAIGLGAFIYSKTAGSKSIVQAETHQETALTRPTFSAIASATTTFLQQEAGMSMYINIGSSLNLNTAKAAYSTVENETSDYVIGSVSVPDPQHSGVLPHSEDVHCFVHKDGWIVVYYLKSEYVGKIIDWQYYASAQLTSNKLQAGIKKVGNILGVSVTAAKYYHFQYPSATKFMIVIKTHVGVGDGSFNIKVPLESIVYERSYSCYSSYVYWGASLKIDSNTVTSLSSSGETKYGMITETQLTPNEFHTVTVSSSDGSTQTTGGCIMLIYQ